VISNNLDRTAVQFLDIYDPFSSIVRRKPVIATHLLFVHQARLGHLQPVVEGVHVTVASERVAMKINLTDTITFVTEDSVEFVQGVLPQVPDLVKLQIQIPQLLQTAQREVDI